MLIGEQDFTIVSKATGAFEHAAGIMFDIADVRVGKMGQHKEWSRFVSALIEPGERVVGN